MDPRGMPNLDSLGGRKFTFGYTTKDQIPRGYVCLHAAVRTDGKTRIGQGDLAFDAAIDEEVFRPRDFAFDIYTLADARGRFAGRRWCTKRANSRFG